MFRNNGFATRTFRFFRRTGQYRTGYGNSSYNRFSDPSAERLFLLAGVVLVVVCLHSANLSLSIYIYIHKYI